MKTNNLITIALKDLSEVRKNKTAWMPAVIIPLVFFVLIPVAILVVPHLPFVKEGMLKTNISIEELMVILPVEIKSLISGKTPDQIFPFIFLGYLFAPMFLIMPLMVSSIISSESFAGERERKTLEGLLYTPTTDHELFLGKVLAAFVPAVVLSWISFLLYTIVVNVLGYPIMGYIWFPLKTWWPLIFWITPAISLLGVSVTVLISSKVNTFMEAYQSGGSLVLIVLGLVVGQATGVLYLSVPVGMAVGLLLWCIDLVLVSLCLKSFKRSNLIGIV